ncbi:uncharacterized protein NEPG_00027 [Nematocida parisii ERTm1]|uniref:uncharacterized protein n=1 Tax=Nematocida parisii (strain ERTm1 / ATCC PRA-289) TaxID=881290 RepID=UPI000264B67D|nr:uncharacterized protein NEPG_00027 [Nematocida parisii ERTm1]EIJ94505.1 hypothetical protein NEPG_00027 [Nematocida parisii ERTm1]|eukprot:XP_013057861.1 hypothetical protein NEPG_00027 [Nematocida parisii ERTm1]
MHIYCLLLFIICKFCKFFMVAERRLTKKILHKKFQTDEDLNEFISAEGTFKDKVTLMTLKIIKERNSKEMKKLLNMANVTENDKTYLIIQNIMKIIEYYQISKKLINSNGNLEIKNEKENSEEEILLEEEITRDNPKNRKRAKINSTVCNKSTVPQDTSITEDESKELQNEAVLFCKFIELSKFFTEFYNILSKHCSNGFLKTKIFKLFSAPEILSIINGKVLDILMGNVDITVDREVKLILHYIKRNRQDLLDIIKDKIIQLLNNNRRVKYALSLTLLLDKNQWLYSTNREKKEKGDEKEDEKEIKLITHSAVNNSDAKETKIITHSVINDDKLITHNVIYDETYLRVLVKLFCKLLVTHSVINNNTITIMLLKGLLRFIKWTKCYNYYLLHNVGYIIYNLSYSNNTKLSMPSLNILELLHITEKVNYVKVLSDTIRKYIYLNDLSKCEILNKAVNTTEDKVKTEIICSAYHTPINSKYSIGCTMVSQEIGLRVTDRVGYALLITHYSKSISDNIKDVLIGNKVKVYNLWDEYTDRRYTEYKK